ncbi:MAG: hypothetical protein DHS20C17_28490 [Cyclobacteriaceae bacterium]|nr:MAG: hypothetical protein DHS20C17_28490 [Cyclobacteriaceae bacterium]
MHLIKLYTPLFLILLACGREPSPPLAPDQELKTFNLAPGFSAELVASEPIVQDPVVIQFDEDGRLWVVEMRGFMPDIDGNGEDQPVGRVSILLDKNNDGLMDSSIVFADSLVLPRSLAIVKDGALIAEDQILWFMEDRNGDLRADKRMVVDSAYGKRGVVEHAPNGLWRGIDNWYYNAKSSYRYRQIDGQWVKQQTEFRGQWGICHDNLGRLYYNYNWSQLHADLVPPNYLSANPHHQSTSGIDHAVSLDRQIFPARENPAINRGYIEGTLDEHGRLIEFTSACAPYIYRGDLFNPEIVGDAFVCEPTGNLIRQNRIRQEGLYPVAKNAYQHKDFLASSDERFRPVWLTSGPDGALYVADMYRGIIQHGLYMSPYLRETTLNRKLDQPVNLGRIWRVLPENVKLTPSKRLSTASNQELVILLGHKNGWYRDMAQRILVERNDIKSAELLKNVILQHPDELAQLHAIWVMEGLGFDDAAFYLQVIRENQNSSVKAAAIRVLESLATSDPELQKSLVDALPALGDDALDLQIALTARILPEEVSHKLLADIISIHSESQLYRDAIISSIYQQEFQFLLRLLHLEGWKEFTSDKAITIELLTTAIARKKDPGELTDLLDRLKGIAEEWIQQAIISGLSFHDSPSASSSIMLSNAPYFYIDPKVTNKYPSEIARISSLFDWPGKPEIRSPSDSIQLADPGTIAEGRNLYLAVCSNCHGSDGKGLPRFGPPLVNSEWVLGDPGRLTRILLHGMEGPVKIKGKLYDTPDILPVMPAFANTPAEDLAAVMTYIRQEWGNMASEIKPGDVGTIRVQTQGKVTPWTADELDEYSASKNE